MWAAEKELEWRCSKTGNASLGASWVKVACAGDKRARACTPKRRGESALRSIGDDVTVKASREDAEWLIRKFKERYEIKTQMIGEAADLDKQLQILSRTVRWSSRGVIKALGLQGASPAPSPGGSGQG